jgi:hypothetical protein
MSSQSITGRGITNVKLWLLLAFIFSFLSRDEGAPTSPLWFLEYLLFALMVLGIVLREKTDRGLPLRIPRVWTALLYVFLAWLFGMIYELTLTVNGEGIGGVHRQTYASFLLAQGDYLLIAITSLAAVYWCRLSFQQMWFLAMGIALTEGLIFMGILWAVILSPLFFLSPLVLVYYSFVYASFSALPLLFLDEQVLWRAGPRRNWGFLPLVGLGFAMGFVIRVVWGLVYCPLVASWFDLPANVT